VKSRKRPPAAELAARPIALGFNTAFNATEAINFAQGIMMARLALRASDRACVLRTGSVALEGRAQDLLADEAVRKAYLG
jgi:hypothetical protein